MSDWLDVYSSSILIEVELRKAILEENGIPYLVIDNNCNSYAEIGFASIELRVPSAYACKVIGLMSDE